MLLSSKADTLFFLKDKLKKSIILPLYIFYDYEWVSNRYKIIDLITSLFQDTSLVIRSSSVNEDTSEFSNAGRYKSIIGVLSSNKEALSSSIDEVISSYEETIGNKVLIQPLFTESQVNGVILTKGINDEPYYIINFTNGSNTTKVTSGSNSNLIYVFRGSNYFKLNWVKILIESVKEIENITKQNCLDIEFSIKNHSVIIFQVRTLNIKKQKYYSTTINRVKETIKTLETRLVLSTMTDWNPIEIIGSKPNNLSISLYKYYVTESTWNIARKNQGYNSHTNKDLMLVICGTPYIDVLKSINSFIPDNINNKLKLKLENYYINIIKKSPELHDKLEFKVVKTCFDFSILDFKNNLLNNFFTENESSEIVESLNYLTEKIIKQSDIIPLINKCYKVFNLVNTSQQDIFLQKKFLNLTREAIKSFAQLARLAFIAKNILISMVEKNIIKEYDYDLFFLSINTIVSEYKLDSNLLNEEDFTIKYGHLRPSTYDITAPRYDSNKEIFLKKNNQEHKKTQFLIDEKLHDLISNEFEKNKIKITSKQFFKFARHSIEAREKAKFLFSSGISATLESISNIANKNSFSREEISNLYINEILENSDDLSMFNEIINTRIRNKYINDHIIMPDFISSKNDMNYIDSNESKPTFITTKSISAEVRVLDRLDFSFLDLNTKIVLIFTADPGFDWIFNEKIGGLITCYGGTASHMAIRCLELGIPAVIGCGRSIYYNASSSEKVLIDCKRKIVKYI